MTGQHAAAQEAIAPRSGKRAAPAPAERQHCDAELGHGSTERGSQAICCCYLQLLMQLRAQRVLLATKGVAAAPAAVPAPLPGGGTSPE